MSRTYRYPIETIENSSAGNEFETKLRIIKRWERQKLRKKRKIKANRSFRKMMSYRDKQRARV